MADPVILEVRIKSDAKGGGEGAARKPDLTVPGSKETEQEREVRRQSNREWIRDQFDKAREERKEREKKTTSSRPSVVPRSPVPPPPTTPGGPAPAGPTPPATPTAPTPAGPTPPPAPPGGPPPATPPGGPPPIRPPRPTPPVALNPAGIVALAAAAVTAGAALRAFTSAVRDASGAAEVNARVAQASAQAQARELEGRFQRTRKVEEELAQFITERSRLSEQLKDLDANLQKLFLPLINSIVAILEEILSVINFVLELLNTANEAMTEWIVSALRSLGFDEKVAEGIAAAMKGILHFISWYRGQQDQQESDELQKWIDAVMDPSNIANTFGLNP